MKPVTLETLLADQRDRIDRCLNIDPIQEWVADISIEL